MKKELTKEYLELFCAVEDTVTYLEKLKQMLISAQIRAEELFISDNDDSELH